LSSNLRIDIQNLSDTHLDCCATPDEWNRARRIQGQITESRFTPGERQALRWGHRLKASPAPDSCSDARRRAETAAISQSWIYPWRAIRGSGNRIGRMEGKDAFPSLNVRRPASAQQEKGRMNFVPRVEKIDAGCGTGAEERSSMQVKKRGGKDSLITA